MRNMKSITDIADEHERELNKFNTIIASLQKHADPKLYADYRIMGSCVTLSLKPESVQQYPVCVFEYTGKQWAAHCARGMYETPVRTYSVDVDEVVQAAVEFLLTEEQKGSHDAYAAYRRFEREFNRGEEPGDPSGDGGEAKTGT